LNLDVSCFDVRDSGLIRLDGMFPVTGLTRE
jgi:hypothetical protein